MCGTKLKMLSALLVLFSLLLFSPASPCLYAEKNVTLTQEEAQELMKLIEESEKDLQDVRNDYSEQKKSYEEQLKEQKRENKNLKIGTVITGTSTAVMSIVCTVLLIIIL